MDDESKTIVRKNFNALGTQISVQIVIDNAEEKKRANDDFEEIEKIYRREEKIFSRFDKESELSKLNRSLKIFQVASSGVVFLVGESLRYYQKSDGIFDPRILTNLENAGYNKDFDKVKNKAEIVVGEREAISGDLANDLQVEGDKVFFGKRMDFSGIAKGYITDKVAKFLSERNWNNFLIDSGGDMFAKGFNDEREKWRIDIEGISAEKFLLEISNEGIATSGVTRRKWESQGKKFHHLIDPKNPEKFDFDIRSVTVISNSARSADVWAKVLFLMGIKEGMEFSRKNNLKSVFLDYRGNAFCL